jgi:hypothetical protein
MSDGLPQWLKQLRTKHLQDQRTQPWKNVFGEDVADRNPLAYTRGNQTTDLFLNGGIDVAPQSGEERKHGEGGTKGCSGRGTGERIRRLSGGSGTFSG